MSPRILCAPVLLLALVFGVSAASARLASHGQLQRPTQTCSSQHPAGLSFRRANGRTFGVLRWRPGPRAPRAAAIECSATASPLVRPGLTGCASTSRSVTPTVCAFGSSSPTVDR